MAKTKASYRNSRRGSAIHNMDTTARDKLDHINHEKTALNKYYIFDTSENLQRVDGTFDIQSFEKEKYAHYYKDGQDVQNAKHLQNRQKHRCRTTDDLYSSPKTKPLESIFQLGKYGDGLSKKDKATITLLAFKDTEAYLQKEYGDHYKCLDFALHLDEKSAHIHRRSTIGYMKDGHFVPGQSEALRQMGFGLPDPTKPRGKYNNELMAFTAMSREYFYQQCEYHANKLGLDLTIDREVKYPSKKHKDKLTHEVDQQRRLLKSLTSQTLDAVERQMMADFLHTGVYLDQEGIKQHLMDKYLSFRQKTLERLKNEAPEYEKTIAQLDTRTDEEIYTSLYDDHERE